MEWTIANLLGVAILTGMSGNFLLDGVVAAAKVPTAAEGNALLLLLLLLMLLALTGALDGEGPVGVTDRAKSKWQLPTKKKRNFKEKAKTFD